MLEQPRPLLRPSKGPLSIGKLQPLTVTVNAQQHDSKSKWYRPARCLYYDDLYMTGPQGGSHAKRLIRLGLGSPAPGVGD